MKNKGLSFAGKIFLSSWIVLCFVTIVILKNVSMRQPTVVRLTNANACEKIGDNWAEIKEYYIGQPIYLCGEINTNVTDFHGQIQIRVYEDVITSQDDAVYYDNLWVSNGKIQLPVNTYLLPGKYVVQVSSGKKTLAVIEYSIVE